MRRISVEVDGRKKRASKAVDRMETRESVLTLPDHGTTLIAVTRSHFVTRDLRVSSNSNLYSSIYHGMYGIPRFLAAYQTFSV